MIYDICDLIQRHGLKIFLRYVPHTLCTVSMYSTVQRRSNGALSKGSRRVVVNERDILILSRE